MRIYSVIAAYLWALLPSDPRPFIMTLPPEKAYYKFVPTPVQRGLQNVYRAYSVCSFSSELSRCLRFGSLLLH